MLAEAACSPEMLALSPVFLSVLTWATHGSNSRAIYPDGAILIVLTYLPFALIPEVHHGLHMKEYTLGLLLNY